MINFFHTELKKLEPTYELSLLKPAVKNPVTKPSKNGTHKKKKWYDCLYYCWYAK